MPQPLGTDERGRDNVSYLPGVVPQYPFPDWVGTPDVLIDAGTHLAKLHQVGRSFDTTGAIWQLPVHQPAEVICHNDFAPYNMVFTGQRLTGVIDWDTASPGPRAWDLAYLAYRLIPLTDPGNGDAISSDLPERTRRLRLLCDSYGHVLQPAEVLAFAVQRLSRPGRLHRSPRSSGAGTTCAAASSSTGAMPPGSPPTPHGCVRAPSD